jgi:subfamily B ATP-binding cassette protein HlyB/CyaB
MSVDNAAINAACFHTGIQCLVALARHHGSDLSVGGLVHEHALTSEPDASHLAAIAEAAGLKARSVTLRWRDLAKLEDALPIIAILRNGNAVIVREVGSTGTVVVLDPMAQQVGLLSLTRERFESAWDGTAVLIKRAPSGASSERRFGLRWFIPELLSQKAAVTDVVVAALMLHVLALALPIFFQIVIDKVLVHEGLATLTVLGIGILIAILFDAILSFLRGFLLLHATTRVDIRIAVKTFEHLLSLAACRT